MAQKCPACDTVNPDTQKYCGECGTSLPASRGFSIDRTETMQPTPAGGPPALKLFAGKYRLIREIGKGGMGVVHEAEDAKLKRTVALKFLPRELLHDDRARERFVHEAQAASALDHPNICTVYEIGEAENGQMFIAMAFCKGESLKAKIRRGPLEAKEIMAIAAQVADGLAQAHEHGIVHRDIKPANILLTKDGQAKIVDFGLAKLAGEARLTKPGTVMGTVAYMSPEQINGQNADARSDVWSLGVVLYEMLAGRLPFDGESEQSFAYAILNKPPVPLKGLPRGTPKGLVQIVEKALAKDPARRYSSGREMAVALHALRKTNWVIIDPGPRPKALSLFAAAAVLLIIVLALVSPGIRSRISTFFGSARSPANLHIAFLPLNTIGGSEDDRILADGLTELLNRQLGVLTGRLEASWVSSVSMVRNYAVKEAADAGRILGANTVFTGTLKRSGDVLNVAIEAVDLNKVKTVKALPRSDNISNLATWQEDLGLEMARLLGVRPSADDRSALAAGGTTVPGALDAYLRGLGFIASRDPAKADRAVAAFEEAVGRDPSFASGEAELAEALRWKSALTQDRALAAQAEAHCRQALSIDGRAGRAHLVLGWILSDRQSYDEARREFEAARKSAPWSFDAAMELAGVYESMRKPAQAEAIYLEALKTWPGYWVAESYLGGFYFYRGETEKARDAYLRGVKAAPSNLNVLIGLGGSYFKLGDYDNAEAAFERANAVKRNKDACSNLGTIYYFRGRFADAVTMYEAAIDYDKSYYILWGNLADAYAFTPGNEAKAAEAYRTAIGLAEKDLASGGGDAQVRSRLAVYLAKTKARSRAGTEILEARRQRPEDPTIVLRAIFVFELSGDRARALDALKTYISLKGGLEEVRRDPYLAALRRDPGYLAIMASVPKR